MGFRRFRRDWCGGRGGGYVLVDIVLQFISIFSSSFFFCSKFVNYLSVIEIFG